MSFKPYKSYNFKDKDPIIDRVRTAAQVRCVRETDHSQIDYKFLSNESGVSYSTIYKMFEGETRFPRHATVAAILGAMGLSFAVVPHKSNVVRIGRKLRGG